jgi:hypothetical protein
MSDLPTRFNRRLTGRSAAAPSCPLERFVRPLPPLLLSLPKASAPYKTAGRVATVYRQR